MRILFVTGGGSATIFALAPLAWAARTAGHEVIMSAPEESAATVADLGLPSVSVTSLGIYQALFWDREGNRLTPETGEESELRFAGHGFGRLAAASLPKLVELAESWKPDLIVGGALSHAAPLLAHRFKIPFVRQAWDINERTEAEFQAATDELQPELKELGLDRIPEDDLYLEITPPGILPANPEPAHPMRWTPGNKQAPLEPWMYTKGERPRVCITSGSRSLLVPSLGAGFFRTVLDNPVFDDVEVIVATSNEVADLLREDRPELKGGWLPLDVVAPTCDLIISHGGGVTTMTVINAGVPLLVLPELTASAPPVKRIDAYGASITLSVNEAPETIAAAVRKMLEDPSYRERAQALSQEIAAMPSAAEVVKVLEKLVA